MINQTIKKKAIKLSVIFTIVFLLLFVFRIIYGYNYVPPENDSSDYYQSSHGGKRNYASKEYKQKGEQHSFVKVDQKYEKIASIKSSSAKYAEEEKQVRSNIDKHNGLIQYEQKSGNEGDRKLYLSIGVPPENFDSLYSVLTKIGKIQSRQITKEDKTNEYKELNAKKNSLEKTRSSLIELKSKGGKIDEYMALENRILEIEQELQDLGVSLGDFDDVNEFCTIQFSMFEGKEKHISFSHRIKVALEWTVKIYLEIIIIAFFIMLFSYLFFVVIDQLKVIQILLKK